jgi:hypothetical protein
VFTGKSKRKFCSLRCYGVAIVPRVVAANKARRKYPPVEGLSRFQVMYRNNQRSRDYYRAREDGMRNRVIVALGAKCGRCGYDDIRALVLDHIDGRGDLDRKRLGGRIARYYINRLDEASEKLQVLCANCNTIKTRENNEHNRSRRVATSTGEAA